MRKRLTGRPTHPQKINERSLQSDGLLFCAPMTENGAGIYPELIFGNHMVPSATNPPTFDGGFLDGRSLVPRFDGSSSRLLSSEGNLNLSAYDKATFCFWMYWDAYQNDVPNQNDFGFEFGTNNNTGGFTFLPNGAGLGTVVAFWHGTAGSAGHIGSIAQPSAAAWHHYAIRGDRTLNGGSVNEFSVFVDGLPVTVTRGGSDVTGNYGTLTVNAMCRPGGNAGGTGRMADIRIYSGLVPDPIIRAMFDPRTRGELYEKYHPRLWPVRLAATRGSGRRRWRSAHSPARPYQINRGSKQAQRLLVWLPAGSRGTDYSGYGRHGILTSADPGAGPEGPVLIHDAITDKVNLGASGYLPTQGITVAFWYQKRDATNRQSGVFGVNSATAGHRLTVSVPWSDGHLYWDFGGTVDGTTRLTVLSPNVTGWHHWVLTSGSRGMEAWQDGVKIGSNAANPTRTASTGNFELGRLTDAIGGDLADFGDFRVYDYQVSEAVIRQMYDPRTRYELYGLPPRRQLWATPTGERLAADPGSLLLTGTAAALRVERKLAADPGSVLISGTAATLRRGLRLACDPGALLLTGTPAALQVARRLPADPGSIVLAGTAAGLRAARRIPADPGAIILTGTDAELTVEGGAEPPASSSYTPTTRPRRR